MKEATAEREKIFVKARFAASARSESDVDNVWVCVCVCWSSEKAFYPLFLLLPSPPLPSPVPSQQPLQLRLAFEGGRGKNVNSFSRFIHSSVWEAEKWAIAKFVLLLASTQTPLHLCSPYFLAGTMVQTDTRCFPTFQVLVLVLVGHKGAQFPY